MNLNINNRDGAIDLAREILKYKEEYVILDTETTGLGDNDVIIQIGIIDLDGNVLMDTLIKPTKRKRISSEATAIHGITMKMLQNAPTFEDIYTKFYEVIGKKNVLAYNAKYDFRLIGQTIAQDDGKIKGFDGINIMLIYSVFVGEWSDYHDSYKFQKLPGGGHTALDDCRATFELIKKMAAAEKTVKPQEEKIEPPEKEKKKWWRF